MIEYIIEANAGLIFFYGMYYLLLRNETDFRKQRIFLVFGSVCAMLFPLIDINLIGAQVPIAPPTSTITFFLPELVVDESPSAIGTVDMLVWIYALVAVATVMPVVAQCFRMYHVVRSAVGSYRNKYYVIESRNNNPSWSFFRLIFIGQSDKLSQYEKDLIVRHEMLHGQLLHSVDTLLFALLCMIFWFNPIVWAYRKTITRIHEFEVDAMVTDENNSAEYGQLLAKTALTANGVLLTHHFNQSFILKRINMLNMLKRRVSGWKLSVLATTIVLYFVAVACTEEATKGSVATTSDEIPSQVSEGLARLRQDYPARTFELKEVTGNTGSYKVQQDDKAIVALYTSPEGDGRSWIITEARVANQEIFAIVEETATPIGGMTLFYEQLAQHLNYPDQARQKGIEGKVFVEFTVMEDGHLTDFKVLKGIGAGCDTEAMRAIMQMPPWTPGKMKGKNVAQKLVMPITFNLD